MEKLTLKELLDKPVWKITVASWGEMIFVGSEEEAEEARRDKANWEASPATKELIMNYGLKHIIISDGEGATGLDNFIERFVTNYNK